jgi:hypothetical protein
VQWRSSLVEVEQVVRPVRRTAWNLRRGPSTRDSRRAEERRGGPTTTYLREGAPAATSAERRDDKVVESARPWIRSKKRTAITTSSVPGRRLNLTQIAKIRSSTDYNTKKSNCVVRITF